MALASGITLSAAPAAAQTGTALTVTGFGDANGTCNVNGATGTCPTLRSAVAYAAATGDSGSPYSISLPAGHYTLTKPFGEGAGGGGSLEIVDGTSVTISGAGATSTVVEASALLSTTLIVDNGGTAALQGVTIDGGRGAVSAGVIDNAGDLTISGSTVSGGMDEGAGGGGIFNESSGSLHIQSGTLLTGNVATSGGNGTGGALDNAGTADVTGATISGNSSGDSGAGIFNDTGAHLTLGDTVVSGNGAGDSGGGIYNRGTLSVTGGQISGNQADKVSGGGVYNDSTGSLTLTGVTVSGNSAAQGGGVYNAALLDGTTGATLTGAVISGNDAASAGGGVDNVGDMTITGSTISGNSVGSTGGGIYNNGALAMVNSTLTRNTTQNEPDATALYNDSSGTANLSFDTLADNPGASGTSTLYNNNSTSGTTVNLVSSILAYAPGLQCAGSAVNDVRGNLFGDTSCDVEGPHGDPQLLPLAQNGTNVPETMALFSTAASPSPALGTTNGPCKDFDNNTVITDENGGSRPRPGGQESTFCDAGAFQLQSGTSTLNTGSSSGADVTLTVLTEGGDPAYGDGPGACSTPSGGIANCGTLRAAVQYADDHPATKVAVELASGEYQLSGEGGALHVTNGEGGTNLTIVGPGAGQTVIEGAGGLGDDILSIDSGATVVLQGVTLDGGSGGSGDGSGAGDVLNGGTLTVTNSTIAGGSAANTGASLGGGIQNAAGASLTLGSGALLDGNVGAFDGGAGGGLANAGTATLTGAVVAENSASGHGGGIFNTGSLTLTNSQVNLNSTPTGGSGGGLANQSSGFVSATGTVFLGNSSIGEGALGGAVYNSGGFAPFVHPRIQASGMTLDGVTVSDSSANGGRGGGVYNDLSGDLTLSGSTVSGNSADSEGGGIFNQGSLGIDHSTLSGNSAVQNDGGGVFNGQSGRLTMVNSTLTANSTAGTDPTDATAFYNEFGTASLSFDTLAGNAGNFNAATLYTGKTVQLPMFSDILAYGTGRQCIVDETPLDGGGNVVGDTTCQLADGEQNLDPLLLPLQVSGGTLQTMPLVGTDSPAVNTSTPPCTDAADNPVTDDERGSARPSTINNVSGCDAGAFQLAGQEQPPPVFSLTPPTVTAVSPAFGPPAGGNPVVITGTGFSTTPGGTTFVFGANPATGVTCSSSTTCDVTAPAGALGAVDVRATVGGLTSATNPGDVYTYVTPPPTGGGGGGPSQLVCSENLQTRFVCQAYLDLQGRTVDPQGVLTWANGLIAGTFTRPQVVLGIDESIEYRTNTIASWYRSYLNRAPDAGGAQFFLLALESGFTQEQLQAQMLGSPEYLARSGGTNSSWLSAVYQSVLNRPIDPAGQALWTAALSHLSRQQVALILLNSPEHEGQLVGSWYARFLHRPVDPGSLSAWVNAMSHGASDEVVIAAIVGSTEYLSHVP